MMMPTFAEYAARVLDQREEEGIRGIVSERNRFQVHVSTAPFADKPLDEIRPRDISEWLRLMAQKEASDTRGVRKLSRATVQRSVALVSAVFGAARDAELVEINPCIGVKLRKRADESATKEVETFLTVEEQRALATCEQIPEADRLAIRFAIATGLRQGEQFNLELGDLHLDDEAPSVFVRYGSKRNGKKLPPKSGRTRRVPILPDGVDAARRWLELLPAFCPDNPDGLVFPTPSGKRRGVGKPLGRVSVNGRNACAWKHALRTAGVRNCRWHDLRHTCASNLVTGALGRRWTLEEIRPLMGHSSINMTQRYSHVGEDALKRAVRETVTVPPAPSLDAGPSIVSVYVSKLTAKAPRMLAHVRRFVEIVAGGAA
jgi:integrase